VKFARSTPPASLVRGVAAALALAVFFATAALPAVAQTTAPATRPSTRPAGPLTVESLLPANKITINVSDQTIADLAVYIAKSYGFRLIDPYRLQQRVTIKLPEPVSAGEAIKLLDDTLLALGYTVLRNVHEDPPGLELRITTASKESGLQVVTGADPAKIPGTDELRTQVIQLHYVDPEKARDLIAPVLDQKADIVINAGAKTLIITDTANRIKTAASLIQVLEKQAAERAGTSPAR
jgi:type II secretory pathway component GspD/PulD (secretin)